jgi:DNA-directed RNA polymerase specialized sigma subunit
MSRPLLSRYQELTPAQWTLMENYYGAARKYASRYARTRPWVAAVIQDAVLDGLCRAAATWDPARGVRFYTWMIRCLQSRISGCIAHELWRMQSNQRFQHDKLQGARHISGSRAMQ